MGDAYLPIFQQMDLLPVRPYDPFGHRCLHRHSALHQVSSVPHDPLEWRTDILHFLLSSQLGGFLLYFLHFFPDLFIARLSEVGVVPGMVSDDIGLGCRWWTFR